MLLAIGTGAGCLLVGVFIGWKIGMWGFVAALERNLTPDQRAQLAAWNIAGHYREDYCAKAR
jgi:hypothetical protein